MQAYDSLTDSIRSVDKSTPIFFAGKTWDDLGSEFTRHPGTSANDNNYVLA